MLRTTGGSQEALQSESGCVQLRYHSVGDAHRPGTFQGYQQSRVHEHGGGEELPAHRVQEVAGYLGQPTAGLLE